jgi:parvulin-like peptidyl-prolyl isomerase
MEESTVADDAARRLVVRSYVKKLTGNASIPESEARAFYEANKDKFAIPEQVTASIIVVLSKPSDAEAVRSEARKRIDEVHKKAVAGDDFAALARQYSQIPNASNGGALGSFGRGDGLPPKIEDIAFSTAPGETSPVFETPAGLCIVKTTAKTPAGTRPYDEQVKRVIIDELGRQREGAAVEAKVAELREAATIEIKEPTFFTPQAAALGPTK